MKLLLIICSVCLSVMVMAQAENALRKRNFNTENYVALREFDPVSYFQSKPVKGNSKIDYDYKGITYFFANEANREEFKKSPAKYEPVYGGWCAYHIATNGQRVKINATTYKIIDGKLYMFSNSNGDNKLLKWNENEKKLKPAADKNWVKNMH